jgi:DNA-binding MarR family transcriptional regulator
VSSTSSSIPGRRLPPLLRRAWFSLNQAFRRRIAHLGLTPDQFTALRSLAEAGPDGLNQRALTLLMSSDPNTITSLLERMEEAGLVRRGADPLDRRVRRVRVTPAGHRGFVAARTIALGLQDEVLAVLPARERPGFLARLETVADACREAAARSPRAVSRHG